MPNAAETDFSVVSVIDAVVAVDEAVSHSHHLNPRDLRDAFAFVSRNGVGGLTDHLEQPQERELE